MKNKQLFRNKFDSFYLAYRRRTLGFIIVCVQGCLLKHVVLEENQKTSKYQSRGMLDWLQWMDAMSHQADINSADVK